ncbi:MAG: hypothetical protein M3507_09330 [Actinomycetota bacterium]|nr:hypothetical protein [Actinomycetota bacterium]
MLDSIVPGTGVVADFFSGTSVVAQGFAGLGRRTMAVDVSPACAAIARATLGEGRGDATDAEQLVDKLRAEAAPVEDALQDAWADYLRVEDDALASKGRIPLATGVDNVVLPVVAALLMLAM